MIAAGFGCRRGVDANAVLALLDRALSDLGLSRADLGAVALPDFKQAEAGLADAAAALNLAPQWIDNAALASRQTACLTASAPVQAATGHASIAEACALAGAGENACLLGPRITDGAITCALAKGIEIKEVEK